MWDTFQRSEFLPSRHPLYEKRARSMAAMERNYEAVCFRCHLNFIQCTFINIVLDQLHQSVSDSKHSEPCRRVFIQTETQDAPALRWRHLAETTEKRKKESLNEASNPNGNEPATMRVMCAAVESEEITRGCLPYHPVFTRRGRLISYAIDWRAPELTRADRQLNVSLMGLDLPSNYWPGGTTKEWW